MIFFFKHFPTYCRVSRLFTACCLVIGLLSLASAQAATAKKLSPVYWHERIFLIPYHVNPLSDVGNRLDKVELLLSSDGKTNWKTLQQAEPNVQGFRYFASADGDYWFTLRTLDRKGNPLQSGPVLPQLYIVIDTQKPVLTITGALDIGTTFDNRREIVLRYEARDVNLRPSSLRVEYQADDQAWSALRLSEHDVKQPDRLMGQVRLPIPKGLSKVKFRASVSDRSGLSTRKNAEVLLDDAPSSPMKGPLLHAPNSSTEITRLENRPESRSPLPSNYSEESNSLSRSPIVDPFEPASSSKHPKLSAQNWPAENEGTPVANKQANIPPPAKNPYMFAQNSSQPGVSTKANMALPLLSNLQPSTSLAAPQPVTSKAQGWNGKLFAAPNSNKTVDSAIRMVNARTFEVEYDLDSVGPWGVARVELWGTHNNGLTWESYGIDPDSRSPMRVSVPAAGLYGFRILVDGANGVGSQSPRSGDPPELSVNVDLQPPAGQLHSTERGQGNLIDHLLIRWTASDSNLELRPISLSYSSYPNGPWSTIASGLQNTGQYAWRLERHVPGQFYLRLEVRDTAGNKTTSQSPTPVLLNRSQPTGRLRGVRPVQTQAGTAEPNRFRTAELGL